MKQAFLQLKLSLTLLLLSVSIIISATPTGNTLISGSYSFNGSYSGNPLASSDGIWEASTPNSSGMICTGGELFINQNTTNTVQQSITLSPTSGTTPGTFVLESISFSEYPASSTFSGNITITGNNPSGSNPTVSFPSSDLPANFSFTSSYYLKDLTATAFAGVKIDAFTITYSSNNKPQDFGIASFVVSTNSNPLINDLDSDALSYTAGASAVVLDQGTLASAYDADAVITADENFSGSSKSSGVLTSASGEYTASTSNGSGMTSSGVEAYINSSSASSSLQNMTIGLGGGAGFNSFELNEIQFTEGASSNSQSGFTSFTITGIHAGGGTNPVYTINGASFPSNITISNGGYRLSLSGTDFENTEITGFTVSWNPQGEVIYNFGMANFNVTKSATAGVFNGGNLLVAIGSAQSDENLSISTSGNVSLSTGMTAGSSVSVSGTAIGTIASSNTGQGGENLKINLNSNADLAKLSELLRAITYECASTTGARTVSFTLTDASSGVSNVAEVDVTVASAGVLLSTSPTLTFTSASGLNDFIAEDGEGGSQSISDIDIQIYNISDVNGTMVNQLDWKDGNWLACNDKSFSAITDPNSSSKGMLIKSTDGSEFELTQFKYYNWGESSSFTNTVKGYRGGSEVASTTFNGFDSNYDPITVTPGSSFSNVDEVRFYISSGGYMGDQSTSDHSINDIQVSSPTAAVMVVSASVDGNASCNGLADGSMTVSVTNGTAPYSYSWSNGGSTASITGLTAGSYTVTVTDNGGTTATASATITEPTVLSASTGSTMNVSCNGGSNGSVSSNATGGLAPYTYVWSNGATTSSITGISAGTYTVTVTDNNGCTSTANATVTQPTALVASTTVNSDVSCNGASDGALGSSGSGGTSPYTYSWSNGGTTASQVGLPAGTYTLTITDNNGCTATSSKTITSPAALDAGEIK